MRSILVLAPTLLCAIPLVAQYPVADSAAVAREEWRAATAALEAGDSTRALAALAHAARAWPMQPAYPLAVARLAARTGATDLALAALASVNALGTAWEPTDPAFTRLAGDPRYRTAEARMLRQSAPMERSRILWSVPDTNLLVEGVAGDPRTGRWFLSSVRERKVLVREPDGAVRDFVTSAQDGLDAAYGLAVDTVRGVLWVASSAIRVQRGFVAGDAGRSGLFAFDLKTGALKARIGLPPAEGGHHLGDVVVLSSGAVLASDSRYPALYRVRPGAYPAVAEVVVEGHPLLRSLQGMAPTADERALYLADYSHGLMRVDLATGGVTALRGPAEGTLLGLDGLASGGARRLIGIQNGIAPMRVIAIHLDAAGTGVDRIEVLDRPSFGAGEPTLGVRVGKEFAYVGTLPAMVRTLTLEP